jgi:hypothetical protein
MWIHDRDPGVAMSDELEANIFSADLTVEAGHCLEGDANHQSVLNLLPSGRQEDANQYREFECLSSLVGGIRTLGIGC